jgi:hypothetical protein
MRGHQCFTLSSMSGFLAVLFFTPASWSAQVRVASYNIQFLSTGVVN